MEEEFGNRFFSQPGASADGEGKDEGFIYLNFYLWD